MVQPFVFSFLTDLKQNNNREWFQENKHRYLEAKKHVEDAINQAILIISNVDPSLGTLSAKDCMFRINRDIRFSKDKSPYKTNFGASITRGGRKGEWAGYYIHLEPKNSFIGGGYYKPSAQHLKTIRTEIFENFEEFTDIVESEYFKTIFPDFYGDAVKTAPKGFPKDFEGIEWLRYKSYAVLRALQDGVVQSEAYFEVVKETVQTLYPLNRFINMALENEQ